MSATLMKLPSYKEPQMSHHIESLLVDGVLQITINRPERKNALTGAMYERLADLLSSAQAQDTVRVLTLVGQPDCFSSGNDMGDFMHMSDAGSELTLAEQPVFRFLRVLCEFDKPIVVGVDGPAVGIGTTLLLHCDHVFCTQRARFSTPFVQLGLCSEAGASLLMPLRIGDLMAREMLLGGRVLSGEQAQSCGLANECVSSERLMERVNTVAQQLAAMPLSALRSTKTLLKMPWKGHVEEAMWAEAVRFAELLRGPAAAEAFTAFMQKRAANFRSL